MSTCDLLINKYINKLHVNIIMLHVDINKSYMNIIMLYVDINKSHVIHDKAYFKRELFSIIYCLKASNAPSIKNLSENVQLCEY